MTYREQMDTAMLRTARATQKARGLGRWPAPPAPDRREKGFNSRVFSELVAEHGLECLRRVGVTNWQIHDYRQGVKTPAARMVRTICKAFGVPRGTLITPVIEDWEG